MATAIEIITRSMRLLGVLSEGETPNAQQSQDALFALNGLMGSLGNSPQMIYARTNESLPLVANVASYTVGPTGGLVTDRPIDILESSTILYQGVTYPLTKWNLADYQQITVTAITGIPTGFYVQTNMPDVTITFWPIPAEAMTFNMWSDKQITTFTSLTQDLAMPPGYDRSLAFILAVEIAPEYEVEPAGNLLRLCSQARKLIKRTNTEVPRLSMPYGIPDNNTYADWRSL